MNKFPIIATSSIILAFSTFTSAMMAHADDDDHDNEVKCSAASGPSMSEEDAKSKATEMGYDVREIEHEDGCFEIDAIGKDGARVELYMNPVTGAIVKTKNKS